MSREIDRELVNRVYAGEKKAFDLLVLKYQRQVIGLLACYVQAPNEIEEIAQEAFIRAYREIPQIYKTNQEIGKSIFAYVLCRLAIDCTRTYLIQNDRCVPEELENLRGKELISFANVLCKNQQFANKEIQQIIASTVQSLDSTTRQALLLKEQQGKNYAEIAQQLALPEATIRSKIFNAREEVAKALNSHLQKGWMWL